MLNTKLWHRFAGGGLMAVMLLLQPSCSTDSRMQKPVADFAAATSVVTAQARLSYGEINRVEIIRAVKTAQRLRKRLDPRELERRVKVLSGEDLAARLDALDNLDEYAELLASIVKSDAPDKIATSATSLQTSLNGLAARIDKLTAPSGGDSSGDSGDAAGQPNTAKFKEKFGIFAAVTREVLVFLAKKKRDDALKRAVQDGDKPVNELIDVLKDDLSLSWIIKRKNLDDDMTLVFQAFNAEITKPQPDENRLEELGDAVVANIKAQDVFYATDPTEALIEMKKAQTKMVEYANRPTEQSFTESIAAIDSFVSAATRLGAAVVKLRTMSNENS